MISKIKNYYEIIYSWFITISIASVGFFAVPAADDFCNFNKINTFNSIYQYVADIYLSWTGRILSTYAIGAAFKYVHLSDVRYLSFFLGLLFCLTGYYFFKLLFNKNTFSSLVFYSIILTTYLFLLLKKSLMGEIVYWPTGGMVYILPIALCAFVLSTLETDKQRINLKTIFLVFILGGALENLTLGVLGYLGTQLLLGFYYKDTFESQKKYLVYILMTVLGALVLFIAPGNFKRAGVSKSSFNLDLDFLFASFFNILKQYLGIAAGALSLFVVILIVLVIIFLRKKAMLQAEVQSDRDVFRKSTALIAGGFVTILPMVFVSDFVASRTGAIFLYFVFYGVFGFCLYFNSRLKIEIPKNYFSFLSLVLLSIFLFKIQNEFKVNSKFLAEYKNREKIILDSAFGGNMNHETELVVDSIKNLPNKHIHFIELSTDPTHWVNACTAEFYKIKNIRVK